MSIDSIIPRLRKLNDSLMTISSLQRLKDMSGKSPKPCTCSHHRSTSRSRCPRKCGSHIGRDKNFNHSCSHRPKICLCNRAADDQRINETSKRSGTDEDPKSQSDYSTQTDQQEKEVENGKKTDFDNRVEQKSASGVASNASIKKNAGNDDGKTGKVVDAKKTVASQSVEIVDNSQTSETDIRNDDKMDLEQMYKELMAEKKRNQELEEKLKETNCSLQCLKNEGEEQAACLKDALEKAQEQAKFASRSRSLAMDLAKQSRDQTDSVKASRDEVLNQLNVVKSNNCKLQCECEELRCKLRTMAEMEEKKCAEVDDKVNRIKCAVKQKEIALTSEKTELEKTVAEQARLVKMQKKRICDLTSICTKQRSALEEHENCIASKLAQLSEAENKIQTMSCRCGNMDDEIEELKCRLKTETEARCNLQKTLDERQDNCNCELQIKDKIIADQVETIKKLKKLLQDSEKMAHQAACEFESLRDELHCFKRSNKSLRLALEEAEARISDECEMECCERCSRLELQINSLSQQKHKALMAAKCAAEKLYESTMDYQRQLDCEKEQRRIVVDQLKRKETEIECLKNEILHVKQFRNRRSNDFIVQ